MTTLELAKKKWEAKMEKAGPRWKKGVTDKQSAYAEGVARFLGVSPAEIRKADDWQEGVNAVSAEDFTAAVRGKEDKWARRLKEALTRE